MPMAAESGLLGSIATSRLAEPTVSLSSANGSAIISGDADLTGITFDLGTAVYTKSVPDLKADNEARIGAPWYILFPPTMRTVPLSPFLELSDLGIIYFLSKSWSIVSTDNN
jgi:hypothetical protein